MIASRACPRDDPARSLGITNPSIRLVSLCSDYLFSSVDAASVFCTRRMAALTRCIGMATRRCLANTRACVSLLCACLDRAWGRRIERPVDRDGDQAGARIGSMLQAGVALLFGTERVRGACRFYGSGIAERDERSGLKKIGLRRSRDPCRCTTAKPGRLSRG